VWAVEVIGEGEREKEEGGETVLTNNTRGERNYKAKYKGTGSPKPPQIRKNNTKSPRQSCRT